MPKTPAAAAAPKMSFRERAFAACSMTGFPLESMRFGTTSTLFMLTSPGNRLPATGNRLASGANLENITQAN